MSLLACLVAFLTPQAEVPAAVVEKLSRGIAMSEWASDPSSVVREDLDQIAQLGFRHVRLVLKSNRVDTITKANEAGLAVVVSVTDPSLLSALASTDVKLVYIEVPRAHFGAAREALPRHTLLVSHLSVDGLAAESKVADGNVIYSFQFNEPLTFTAQGLKPLTDLRNLPYPSTPTKIARILSSIPDLPLRGIAKTYGDERWDAQKIARRVRIVAGWAAQNKVRVVCSQFGVARQHVGSADRCAYLRDVALSLADSRIGWTLSDYTGPYGVFSGSVGGRNVDRSVLQALSVTLDR